MAIVELNIEESALLVARFTRPPIADATPGEIVMAVEEKMGEMITKAVQGMIDYPRAAEFFDLAQVVRRNRAARGDAK